MKTVLQLLGVVLISTLLINANCQNALGNYTTISVPSAQSNSSSCRIILSSDDDYTSNLTNAYTNITQTFIPDPNSTSTSMPAGCSFLNITFNSFFNGDSSTHVVPFTVPVHENFDGNGSLISSWVNTTILTTDLAAMNGTECLYLYENQTGYDQYLCSVNFGGTPLYWVAFGTGSGANFTFADFNNGSSVWVGAANQIITQDQYYENFDLNTTFPNVVADIYSSCGSNNKNFYSLQTEITVSTSIDFAAVIPQEFGYNITQAYVIVKQTGASAGQYITFESAMSAVKSGELC